MAQITKNIDKLNNVQIFGGQIVGRTPASRASSGTSNNGFTAEDLRVFKYIAANPSGSRFVEVTDFTTQWDTTGAAGDRLYFGAPYKTWAIKTLCTVAKTSEKYIAKYYSINADDLIPVSWMSMNDECLEQNSKNLWQITNDQYFTINKNINSDWLGTDNILDKIPNTGDSRYWNVLEVPVGGIATPAKIRDVVYRSNGVAKLECNSQNVYFGNARLKKSDKIPAIAFWNGGVPETASINITSTLKQTVHKLRNAADDAIHSPYALPFGIDTSTPMEIALTFAASQAINTGDIEIDLKGVSYLGGAIGTGETSDRIVTTNINIPDTNIKLVQLIADYDISNYKECDTIFVQLKRTDSNGGSFYPINAHFCCTLFKEGKIECS